MASSELSETPALWLKAQTRREHLATEETQVSQKLARGELNMGHFLCLLASYQRLHADVETMASECGYGSLLRETRRSELAEQDLQALGCEASDLPVALLKHFAAVLGTKAPSSPAYALGRLYVMEGSALGAAMLAPVVERALGLSTGLSYFRGAGKDTMPKWFVFRGVLDRELSDPERREEARRGAAWQFELVRSVFEVIDVSAHETRLKRLEQTG